MKLKKIKIENKIIYTLKNKYKNRKTEDAHYKFIKEKSSD